MLYNIKQAGGLKASPMHAWLGLALFSLFNKQLSTSKESKQPTDNLLIVLKTFSNLVQIIQLALGLLSTN